MVPDKLLLTTPNPIEERLEALRELFPEAFKEGKLDLETFKLLLGEKVETGRERYGLSWAGKSEAIRAVQIPSSGTLRPRRGQSVDFDPTENVIIEGDNLEVLKLLQQAYHGKVKLIYIDPPYNTGNDFVYPDDFREGVRQYLRFTGQLSEDGVRLTTAAEEGGRVHSKWLSMMYPRLQLARSLLRDDGVIFISIDDHELQNLRAIMDEIFGEENFVANIVWRRTVSRAVSGKGIAVSHDHILCYAKSDTAPINRLGVLDEENYKNPDNDPRGPYKLQKLERTLEGARPSMTFPIETPTGSITRTWSVSPDRYQQLLSDNRIVFSQSGMPYYKQFLGEYKGSLPDTWWDKQGGYNQDGTRELKALLGDDYFSSPKPVALIKLILQLSTTGESDELVIDFFAGSGTVGQAVMEMNNEDGGNRKFLLVQLPEPTNISVYPTISSITRARVQKAAERIRTGDKKLADQDLGFRAFSLDTSNFKLWNGEAEDIQGQLEDLVDNLVEGRSQEDVLLELLLKAGLPLSSKIQEQEIQGQKVFSVAEGQLLICLERPVGAEALRAMMTLEPRPLQVVCLDVAFLGNDALKTNIVLEMRDRGIRFRTV